MFMKGGQKGFSKHQHRRSKSYRQPPQDFVKVSDAQSGIRMKGSIQLSSDIKNNPSEGSPKIIQIDQQYSLVTPMRLRTTQAYKKNIRQVQYPKEQSSQETKKKRGSLEQIHEAIKIAELIKLFHQKVSCKSISRTPIEFDPLESGQAQERSFLYQMPKFSMPRLADTIITAIKIIYILLYLFAFPLSLLFTEVNQSQGMITLKSIGLMLCILEILDILQMPNQRPLSGHYTAEETKDVIAQQKNNLILQLVIITSTIASLIMTEYELELSSFLFITMVINIKKYMETSLSKLESQFITANFYQKYWDIAKVLALNLLVCHILACILISITYFKFSENWMTRADIYHSPWIQKYIWSYYFGITIILTVGFGDLHAVNYVEAFFIIFISFFAVVFFGYNINYIGNKINSIRQDDLDKNQKLKVFSSLTKKTPVPEELKTQITNYIIQEAEIKKVSNFIEQKKLVQQLPKSLKTSFLQASNKQLFSNLFQLKTFTKKAIETFSENIQTKICHPQQIIKKAQSTPQMIILQSGEVGYSARVKGSSKINGIVLERVVNSLENPSKLVCVDVLASKPVNYDIKALSYSVIYYLDKESFENALRSSPQDFQNYRQIRDKCQYKINEFQLTNCRFCPNKKHTLFNCPRLHFTPFRQTLPSSYYHSRPHQKQERKEFMRNKKKLHFEYIQGSKEFREICQGLPHLNSQYGSSKLLRTRTPKLNMHSASYDPSKKKKNSSRVSYLRTIEVVNQVRNELQRIKEEERGNSFYFSLWNNCDCEEAHDYSYYFPSSNPSKLVEKAPKRDPKSTRSTKKKLFRKITEGSYMSSM